MTQILLNVFLPRCCIQKTVNNEMERLDKLQKFTGLFDGKNRHRSVTYAWLIINLEWRDIRCSPDKKSSGFEICNL